MFNESEVTMFICKHIENQNECDAYKDSNIIFYQEPPTRYISRSTRYEVLDRQHWRCNICGIHLKYSESHSYGEVVAHIDHIHPFSQWKTYDGYINELSNLEALCPDCNFKKHSKGGF